MAWHCIWFVCVICHIGCFCKLSEEHWTLHILDGHHIGDSEEEVPHCWHPFSIFGTFPQSALRKGLEKIKAQHVVNGPAVALFNYSWKIIWAVSDPTPIARREDFSFVFVTFWPSYVSNRQEMRWSDVNYPWRLYATVKLDFISLTTRPGVVYL